MTTQLYKLTSFMRQRKYFNGLIFFVEGDRRKFFHNQNSQSTVITYEGYEHLMHNTLTGEAILFL